MNMIVFRCQNFFLRVFIHIPVIFFLAKIEGVFFDTFFCSYKSIFYIPISAVLALIYINAVFKYTEKPFLYTGELCYEINSLSFKIRNMKRNIPVKNITNIYINNMNVYKSSIIQLRIEYHENSKKHRLTLYSGDLKSNDHREDSLYKVYEKVKVLTEMCS